MKEVQEIAKRIGNAGGKLYLVGGAVRDLVLEREIQDEDYCVVGISKDVFSSLFPEAKWIGKSFGVFELHHREFAMARRESKKGIGHKEFEIELNEKITIEEDLARRDLTINAMAKEVLTGKIIDPYGGMEDIRAHQLKAIGPQFMEDPLRIYRVARFASNLEFKIDQYTKTYMKDMVDELHYLSKERVCEEFRKALKSKKPSIFFEVLRKVDALNIHFKEIQDLIGSIQPEKYHPEGDSYIHTMQVLDKASEKTKEEKIRFSALVHDLGKGTTPKEMYPHHYGHDERGVKLVENLGEKIGVPKEWIDCGKTAAKEHMLGGIFLKMSPAKQVSFLGKGTTFKNRARRFTNCS